MKLYTITYSKHHDFYSVYNWCKDHCTGKHYSGYNWGNWNPEEPRIMQFENQSDAVFFLP